MRREGRKKTAFSAEKQQVMVLMLMKEGRNGFPQNEPFATIMNKEKAVEFNVAQMVERKLLTLRSAVRILSSVNYISYQL